jgi:excisionase family DNA binding protein
MGAVSQTSEWLTTQQACQFLHVTPHTLYNWVRRGRVKAFKNRPSPQGRLRFRKGDMVKLRDEQCARALRAQLEKWRKEAAQLTDEEWENDSAAGFGSTKIFYSDVEDGSLEHDHYIYGSRKQD